MDASWTYFLILGASLAYPLAQSFEKRVFMYRKMKYIFPGIIATGIIFIIWDYFFTSKGVWGFNHSYTRELYIAGLPVEEWLFFLVIPYCVFFVHEVLRLFVRRFYFPGTAKIVIIVLLMAGLISLPFIYTRTYTFTAVAFVIPFLALQLLLKTWKTWFSGFMITYLVALVPFIIVNGLLTSIPVVWYNNLENLGIRITTIPLEDFIYLLGMLLPAFTSYQYLLHRFGSPKLKSKMGLESVSGF